MRIGIDATALYGRYGGVEYSLWNLLCALHAADEGEAQEPNEYFVYLPQDGPPFERLSSFNERWHWRRLPFEGGQKLRRILWQQRELPRQLLRDRCQLLHAPTYVAPARVDIPVVLTVYDLIALAQPQFATALNRAHYKLMLPLSISRAARVLVPSAAVREQLSALFPSAAPRTRVVPLGVEPIFLRPPSTPDRDAARVRYDLPEKYLLYVGNYEPKKNLANLLRAYQQLPDAPPLVIAGGARAWPLHEMEMAGAGSDRVRQIGYVARRDLPALYAGCEAFVFPSLAEGFGLPVLEALACGAATVTSPAVPLPDLAQVAAICDPHSPAAIASAVQRVLREPAEQQRLQKAGRAYARSFTWRETARGTLQVYREALSVQL